MHSIEQEFREKVTAKIRIESEGSDRFRIFTPLRFDDGDHLVVVLKRKESQWLFSDEAHTFMRLTYDIEEKQLLRGTRQKIISDVLTEFQVEDRDGELVLVVPEKRFGDAFYSFVQAILKISDVSFLTKERIHSAYIEEFAL